MTPALRPTSRRPARRWPYALLGVGLSAAVLGGSALVLATFGGTFSSYAAVEAELPASSTAVALNGPVEFRNVEVGKVVSTGRTLASGAVEVTLHLNRKYLRYIPSNVQATVAPVSIFGNQYVVLQPAATPSHSSLHNGDTIVPVATGATASLQGTLGDLDTLLNAVHPAALDAALTAVATSLQGQGHSLGQTLVRAHVYLNAMQPLWPTVVRDLALLAPVGQQLTTASPNILALLANFSATSLTLTESGANLPALISGGAQLANSAEAVLRTIQEPFALLAAGIGPFFTSLTQTPTAIAQLLSGLSNWAQVWSQAESSGPYLTVGVTVRPVNPADLGLALIGGPDTVRALSAGLGASFVNPATYTAADCPQFGSLVGPNCARTIATSVMPASQEKASVTQIAAGATGVRPQSVDAATLILSPLLGSMMGKP